MVYIRVSFFLAIHHHQYLIEYNKLKIYAQIVWIEDVGGLFAQLFCTRKRNGYNFILV